MPSSFSYACIDSLAMQSDLGKCRRSVDIAIILLAICYINLGALELNGEKWSWHTIFAIYISIISERACISSVQWKSAIYIYMYVCIVIFYRTFMRASTNNRDCGQIAHSTWAGVTLSRSSPN